MKILKIGGDTEQRFVQKSIFGASGQNLRKSRYQRFLPWYCLCLFFLLFAKYFVRNCLNK